MDIKLPNLGDGIDSAVVLSILVSKGDTIQKDQTILELETDKAVAPIPSPQGGTVEQIYVKVGDTVTMGTPVLGLSGGVSAGSAVAAPASAPAPVQAQAPVASIPVAPVAQAPIPQANTGPTQT
ncbi:hypothetical protein EBR96_08815, partial [bacterium]|nr:hypothetical protein [bacterium]